MKYLILLLYALLIIGCCSHKYITIPLSAPPEIYKPNSINTQKDLINEYKKSIIKITQWQNWYNIQVNTNYFHIL